jgi:hypothetical protein
MTHPLTHEVCLEITNRPDMVITRVADLQTAADWQLDRVLDWLDKNLSNYTDDTYLGDMIPLHRLDDDLKEAMRPTQEDNS